MEYQVAEFSALLNQVHLRKAPDLVVEPVKADKLGQNHARVIETESLVKVARQKILLKHVLVLLLSIPRLMRGRTAPGAVPVTRLPINDSLIPRRGSHELFRWVLCMKNINTALYLF